jgi:hypothetical protein
VRGRECALGEPNLEVVDTVFVRSKLIAAVSAIGLGLGVAAQATGAEHPEEPSGKAQAKLEILERPSDRFDRSIEVVRKQLEKAEAKAAAAPGATPTGIAAPESIGVSSATLEAIAACESGGDPSAVSADGTYRGKYQFDYGTWASVGGSGDPAAAPEAEQDMRAALLYQQAGSSPWPVCGV